MQSEKDSFTEKEWEVIKEMVKDPFLFPSPEKKKAMSPKVKKKKVKVKRNKKKWK